jgi:hypothetical protein
MTHHITVEISPEKELEAVFTCYEPDSAWCRQNAVGPTEAPPEDPLACWFTVLASGLVPWGKLGIYIGPPTELRSGEIEFVRAVDGESDEDMCFWHYPAQCYPHVFMTLLEDLEIVGDSLHHR